MSQAEFSPLTRPADLDSTHPHDPRRKVNPKVKAVATSKVLKISKLEDDTKDED